MKWPPLALLMAASCFNGSSDSVEAVFCQMVGPEDGMDGPALLEFRAGPDGQPIAIEIRDDAGPVEGQWTTSGRQLTFKPTNYLQPTTTYSWAETTHCTDTGRFTTSDVGEPVTNPQVVVGQTFEGALCGENACRDDAARYVVGINEKHPFNLRIDALDPQSGRVELSLAQTLSREGTQDTCAQTTAHVGTWRDDAYIVVAGDRLSITMENEELHIGQGGFLSLKPGVALTVWDWELVFAVQDEPPSVQLSAFTGQFDYRYHADDFVNAICGGVYDCEPCPDGVNSCVAQSFSGLEGAVVPDLVEVAPEQRENHLCEVSCSNGVDDDEDGTKDEDEECDVRVWPGSG